jgi:hypothetical protein
MHPMLNLTQDWEFNVLDIYNYRKPGQYKVIFDFVKKNHDLIPGDILEAGVFRGKSLIAMGMFLKEIGSNKRVFGFDSFSGFPPIYNSKDDLTTFESLYKGGKISKEHFEAVKKNIEWRKLISRKDVDIQTISSSGDFSGTSLDFVKRKINFIGLDNIVLINGQFAESMRDEFTQPENLMAVLMDCDLYESYKQAFRFVWPRLSPGGLVYLDEYYSLKFPGARVATNEFLDSHQAKLNMATPIEGDFERWFLVKPIEAAT